MFVPRCLRERASITKIANVGERGKNPEFAEEPIKSKSSDQRRAEDDEPKCVVCSRYGEYVCDETDDDVCSLQCKNVVLLWKAESSSFLDEPHECLLVGNGKPRLADWESELILSPEQALALRKQIDIFVKGDSPPCPIVDFSNCKLLPKLKENLTQAGYNVPTSIQMQAIPAALKGRDILVSSNTGSGKTLAFILPIIMKSCRIRIGNFSEGCKPLAMVLAPTRELCMQVEEQAKTLGKRLPFKTALVVGGDAMPQQLYRIRKGVELIVGTPGRLTDLLQKHDIDLSDVCILVLDEVDCMLERGFRDQVMLIMQALSQPQIMMFSATIPQVTQSFCTSILKTPLMISHGHSNASNEAVKQVVIWIESKNKKKKLFDIIQSADQFQPPAIVFVSSRMGADLLAEAITAVTRIQAASIHGQKSMSERRQIMKSLLDEELSIVVATDVLGRGLDILSVRQVILFDMPNSMQEYKHQIGRASRMGVPGCALVFINNESKALFNEMIGFLRNSGMSIPPQLLNSRSTASKRKSCI